MDSSGTRGGGCDPEAPYRRTNVGKGIPRTVGAGVSPDGCGFGT